MPSTTVSSAMALAAATGLASVVSAQTFQRFIGAPLFEEALDTQRTPDGGLISTGVRFDADQNGDILVVKHFPDGKVQWAVSYGGPGLDIGHSVINALDGGYLVAAETTSVGPALGIALVKLDAAGNVQWSFVYPGLAHDDAASPARASGVQVIATPEGYALVGRDRVSPTVPLQFGVFLRTTPAGVPVVLRRYLNPLLQSQSQIALADLRRDDDGTFAIVGTYVDGAIGTPVAETDLLHLRVDAAGNPLLARIYESFAPQGLEAEQVGAAIEILPDRTIAMVGRTAIPGAAPARGVELVRIVPPGPIQWFTPVADFDPGRAALRQTGQILQVAGSLPRQTPLAVLRGPATLAVDAIAGPPVSMVEYIRDGAGVLESVELVGGGFMAFVGGISPGLNGGGDLLAMRTDAAGFTGCEDTRREPAPLPLQMRSRDLELASSNTPTFTPWQGVRRGLNVRDPGCEGARPCNLADIVSIGGFPPPDGALTVDDYTSFINAFAADDALADVVSIGGFPPPDGLITVDDYTSFINAFAEGCD